MAVHARLAELHRLSPAEYRRLVEAGVFDEDARVELLDGLLVDLSPKTRAHENAIAWLAQRLMLGVDLERFEVRVGAPLTIGTSEPEPDLAVIARAAPRPHHPASAEIVIEVAVSSLDRDLHDKPPIYAAAGVPTYVVVDLDHRRVVLHTTPSEDRYADVVELSDSDTLVLAAVGIDSLLLSELLAAASA